MAQKITGAKMAFFQQESPVDAPAGFATNTAVGSKNKQCWCQKTDCQ
jgi:hypothetical protein